MLTKFSWLEILNIRLKTVIGIILTEIIIHLFVTCSI